jgi:arylsulfatase A-like enzyme
MKRTVTAALCLLISACLTVLSCRPSPSTDPGPPNILFIMSDDHSSQAWGVYGSQLDAVCPTPNIQRLALEGSLLLNCFCTNSICVPSRASILTGQYSHQNGVYTLSDALDPEQDHVGRILQRNGYQTAMVGKWHLKTMPAGFDYFSVLPGQGRYHNPILRDRENWEEGREYEGFSTDVITNLSLDWLETRDLEKPFFLMCHFKATHEPFDFADRFADLFAEEEIPEPESLYEFGQEASGRTFTGQVLEILGDRFVQHAGTRYPGGPFKLEGLPPREARKQVYQKFLKDYLRSVAGIDENIGRLLAYLDRSGLADRTVVIYTSDQGYFLGEHGFFDKRIMYEEALRMPFVVRYPSEIQPGTRTSDIILNTDFAPLFLDYAGIGAPTSMQGVSFRGNLRGETPNTWRRAMYYRYWQHQAQRPAHLGIRTERYKLIFFYGKPLDKPGTHPKATPPAWEFYDLRSDPQELRNAYSDPQYKDLIQDLKQRLETLRLKLGDNVL